MERDTTRDVRMEDVLTRELPLGAPFTEAFVHTSDDVFRKLYDGANHIHATARSDNPSYIVGRKGSGKTAFLLGASRGSGADVVHIQSEHIYSEVNRLRARYSQVNGALVTDSLVHVWEVLLLHAAILAVARSERIPNTGGKQRLWSYISSFGDPRTLAIDELLARVSGHMVGALITAPGHLSFREACWAIEVERGSFRESVEHLRRIMDIAGARALYVVVDNLEDLHKHMGEFEDVIAALFRVASRALAPARDRVLPFRTRFAFPAELLSNLRYLAANAEKDFLDYLVIRWTAAELMVVAGNRLRVFLDVHFPSAPRKLGLPTRHDPRDREAAQATLRAMLPAGPLVNGFGGAEDPIAYVMRHTQLLPRHLIEILNEIIAPAIVGLASTEVPRTTHDQVRRGVRKAERRIVEGILTTYSFPYPRVAAALAMIKNHIDISMPASQMHEQFNHASTQRSGMSWEQFLDACLAVGALGIATGQSNDSRYVQGEFSYTFAENIRPVEDRDVVCVHPLFTYRFFDRRTLSRFAQVGARPVYPYGSDPEHDDFDT